MQHPAFITIAVRSSIDHFVIQPGGKHDFRRFHGLHEMLELQSIDCSIPLREIYHKTELAS